MKTFVAVTLNHETISELSIVKGKLMTLYPLSGAAFEKDNDLHLTLRYLGNIEGIDLLIDRLSKIRFSPFSLALDKLETFENEDENVVWIGVSGETDRLTILQQIVTDAVCDLNIKSEPYDFLPHITLAYTPEKVQKSDLSEIQLSSGSPFDVCTIGVFSVKDCDYGSGRFGRLAEISLRGD